MAGGFGGSMMRWLVAATMVLPLMTSSAASQAQGPDPIGALTDSGIEGQVVIGPTCPGPTRGDRECQARPYQATIRVLDEHGGLVTVFQTAEAGEFRLPLAPGTYTLQPEPAGSQPFPFAKGQTTTVTTGQFTQVRITYDTGLR